MQQKIERVHTRFLTVRGHRSRWNSHADQGLHPRTRTRGAQTNRCSKRETRKDQRQVKLRVEPVESGANVFYFSVAVVVLALAESGAAEVEAQHGKAKTVQRLHGVEHDFVMQRATKQGMGMAYYRGVPRALRSSIEQRFQPACWALEEERLYG